jgi:uncharacterized protein YceK
MQECAAPAVTFGRSWGTFNLPQRIEIERKEGVVRKFSLVVAAGLILGGCTSVNTEIGPTNPVTGPANMRAKFLKEGFNLKVTHTRWQWMTDMDAMFEVCRRSIHEIADQISVEKGREIEPIDNDKIGMDYNRNDMAGTSTCIATYPVAYKQ